MECPGTSAGRRFVGPCLTWARQLEIHYRCAGMLWSCRMTASVSNASISRGGQPRGSRWQFKSGVGPPTLISGMRARLLLVGRVDSEAGKRVRLSVEAAREHASISLAAAGRGIGDRGVGRAPQHLSGGRAWAVGPSVLVSPGDGRDAQSLEYVGCRQRAGGQPAYSGIAQSGAGVRQRAEVTLSRDSSCYDRHRVARSGRLG